ncbi:hypothetical protein [Galbibacter mesophilus]|uniref:hypothetical protein n=1 Tax=Galbibacter mesophilus TaxID=379069 RepID=UPI001A919FD7|nr:hypothetical protein [Galbibacter mesophilus]MCM5662101.1 hypothetical protein [Galbibacter mesophilus]
MKKLLHRLLLIFAFWIVPFLIHSQIETTINVFIYKDGKAVENFGIANLTTKAEGEFKDGYHSITASEGDELFFASSDFKNFYKLVTTEHIITKKIEVYTKEGVIELDEVILTDKKLSYGTFTDYIPKTHTPAERRLNAATSGLSLDPIINMISGRTKKLKKLVKAETKSLIVEFLEDNYIDYIRNELEVPEEHIGLFCYFVSDRYKAINKGLARKRVEYLLRKAYFDFVKDPAEQ